MLKVKRILILLLIFLTIMMAFPSIFGIIKLIQSHDIIYNHNQYKKVNVIIDSISVLDNEGADQGIVYGYSKNLNNYKCEINFNFIKYNNFSKELNMNKQGIINTLVWYRKGINKAYLANKEDVNFPVLHFIFIKIKATLLFLTLFFISRFIYKKYFYEPIK